MSWNWYEYFIDQEGDIEYYKCQKCDKYPALALTWQDSQDYGPYCELHWHLHMDIQFRKLSRKLDDEGWGSSPDLEPPSPVLGKCEICEEDLYKIYKLHNKEVCCNCYEEYRN